jgi:hypothetical protein
VSISSITPPVGKWSSLGGRWRREGEKEEGKEGKEFHHVVEIGNN